MLENVTSNYRDEVWSRIESPGTKPFFATPKSSQFPIYLLHQGSSLVTWYIGKKGKGSIPKMPPKIQALGILGKIIQQRKSSCFFLTQKSPLWSWGTLFSCRFPPAPVSWSGKPLVFHSPLPAEANKKLAPLLNFKTHFKVRPSLEGKGEGLGVLQRIGSWNNTRRVD